MKNESSFFASQNIHILACEHHRAIELSRSSKALRNWLDAYPDEGRSIIESPGRSILVYMTLGEKITKLRKQKDWTQAVFARKIGVHGRHVSRWETDKMKPPVKRLKKIAEVLDTNPEELIRDNGSEPVIQDRELLKYLEQMRELNDKEKEVVVTLIKALSTKRRLENALKSEE